MKDLVLFTSDEKMLNFFEKYCENNNITNYPYDMVLENIDFNNKIVIVDIDNENLNIRTFLNDLSLISKTTILVLSNNCERKNINLCARNGADRFIVKPINRKRFKNIIEPYFYKDTNENLNNSELESQNTHLEN